MHLTVVGHPSPWSNCVLANYDGELKIGALVYRSRSEPLVPTGCIALNQAQRRQCHVNLGDTLEVQEHSKDVGERAESMNLLIRSIEEEQYDGPHTCEVPFKTLFDGQYFVLNQLVIFQAYERSFLATVKSYTGGNRLDFSTRLNIKYN